MLRLTFSERMARSELRLTFSERMARRHSQELHEDTLSLRSGSVTPPSVATTALAHSVPHERESPWTHHRCRPRRQRSPTSKARRPTTLDGLILVESVRNPEVADAGVPRVGTSRSPSSGADGAFRRLLLCAPRCLCALRRRRWVQRRPTSKTRRPTTLDELILVESVMNPEVADAGVPQVGTSCTSSPERWSPASTPSMCSSVSF